MARPHHDPNAVSTPQRILAAAERAFAGAGYEARLSDIAAEAGIRRSSLLYHFETKKVLYAAVVTDAFLRLGLALRDAREVKGEFEDQLQQMTSAFVRFVEDHPLVARLVVRELLAADGPGSVVLMERVAPLLGEVELWICAAGAGQVRAGAPVRAALLHVVSDVLLRSAAGPVRDALWGDADEDKTWWMARTLLLPRHGDPA